MSGELPTIATICAACGGQTPPAAAFCPACGAARMTGRRAATRWYYNPWFVLVMLSPIALGPFGLPLLWKSPAFSRTARNVLTLLTLAWTILAIWYFLVHVVPAIVNWAQQLNTVFQGL